MSYQVYFADMTEENQSLTLAILRLKEEAEQLEPGEAELLTQLRGADYAPPSGEELAPAPGPLRRMTYRRRRGANGHSGRSNGS